MKTQTDYHKKEFKKWNYESIHYDDDSVELNVYPPFKKTVPNVLYKYFSVNENSLKVLLNHEIFAAHPINFNDPFDCYNDLIDYSNLPESFLIEELKENGFENVDQMPKSERLKCFSYSHYIGMFSRLGIISLCNNPLSMPMWAYYADSHSGFAIEFESKEFTKRFHGPFPINYNDNFDKIDIFEYGPFVSLLYQTTIKSKTWDKEEEWRYIAERPNMEMTGYFKNLKTNKRTFDFGDRTIKKIIFGYNFFNFLLQHDFQERVDRIIEFQDDDKLFIKHSILEYAEKNSIPTEIITIRNNDNFKLDMRPIEYRKISNLNYLIQIKNKRAVTAYQR